MSVTEPLRHEHADLYPHLDELDAVAARIGDWNAERAHQLAAVVAFLREHLVPHARAEEAALYPMVEQVMRAPGATDTMQADHVEIVRRIERLAATIATVGNGPPAAPQTEELRGQLYGLSAILRLHFAKEEEVLLPVLDAHLSPDDATHLFAEMSAAAHSHEGPTT
jgi:iron-sulfur cluster repair protein YtfE (RIC family)